MHKKNRMMSTKIAAIAQLCSTSNKLHNLYNIAHCAGWAKKHGASMLFLPECFGFIGSNVDQTLKNAERIPYENDEDLHDFKNEVEEDWYSSLEKIIMECSNDDDLSKPRLNTGDDNKHNNQVSILNGLRVIAKKSDLFISAGGIHESCAPPLITEGSTKDRVYNTHLILNNKGEIVSRYRKIHLFDVSIPSQGIHLRESATTAPGTKLVVCDSPLGKLGLSTCYDLRFPEMYQELSGNGGANILLVPSAFTVPTGQAHWHTLLRARAIENQCYVLAAAQCGRHNEKRESYGHSIAIDPWGEIIADAGGYDSITENNDTEISSRMTPKIILCAIEDNKIKSTRERIPVKNHRETCTFSW